MVATVLGPLRGQLQTTELVWLMGGALFGFSVYSWPFHRKDLRPSLRLGWFVLYLVTVILAALAWWASRWESYT